MSLTFLVFILTFEHVFTAIDNSLCVVPSQHPNYNYIDTTLICGLEDPKRVEAFTAKPVSARMLGGEAPDPGVYPWIVSITLHWPNDILRTCVGTLISSSHVLTSGSCLYWGGAKATHGSVFAGDTVLRKKDCITVNETEKCAPNPQQRIINSTHVHKNLWKSFYYDWDIAVLQFGLNFTFDAFVRPICLTEKCPDPNDYVEEDFEMFGYGWKPIDTDDDTQLNREERIIRAEGIGVRKDHCQKRWRSFDRNVTITDRVICVDPVDQDMKPCGEDIGSPLTQRFTHYVQGIKKTDHHVVGVLAFALSCRERNPVVNPPPLVYTNVGLFNVWIMNNLAGVQWEAYET